MSLVASLAACGGGGGDSTPAPTPGPAPAPAPGPAPGPAPAPGTSLTISGTATFASVPPGAGNTGLNYAGAVDKPIRGATAQLIDAGNTVLATTTTDASGNYGFSLATSQAVTVRVRAEIKRIGSANGDRDFTIRDNTSGDAVYVLDSAAFTPTTNTTQNLRAASGWNGTSYTGTRAAGPFAILDVVYDAQAKIATAAPTVNLPVLKLFWSINNRPVSPFNATTGAITTSFFTSAGGSRALYILGTANTDTDEYDTHVVAHEFGHYVQSAVSRDDSPGGSHGSGDKLDLRLAFSEGWGNGWSGIALNDPRYVDSFGTNQSQSFSINVNLPATSTDRGAYSETASQYLIYSSSQTFGFTPVYGALTRFPSSPAYTTLYNFADALKVTSPTSVAAITSLWATQNIAASDAFGSGETNDGGVPTSLPVYKTLSASPTTYCLTGVTDTRSDGNKLGEYMYVRFTASGARVLTLSKVSATYATPTTTDPDFVLLRSDGVSVNASSSVADSETLNATLPTGTHAIALQDYNLPSNQGSCFAFTVN